MLVELNTFKFTIETHNGIIEPCLFVVRTKVCNLKLLNSNFHHDDVKSLLHFFSLKTTSKQQKDITIFFSLTFLLKMACKKMDKGDFFLFFFLIQRLLFAFDFKCLLSHVSSLLLQLAIYVFLVLDSNSDKLKVIVVYCKSSCHLNPMLFHYQSSFDCF